MLPKHLKYQLNESNYSLKIDLYIIFSFNSDKYLRYFLQRLGTNFYNGFKLIFRFMINTIIIEHFIDLFKDHIC